MVDNPCRLFSAEHNGLNLLALHEAKANEFCPEVHDGERRRRGRVLPPPPHLENPHRHACARLSRGAPGLPAPCQPRGSRSGCGAVAPKRRAVLWAISVRFMALLPDPLCDLRNLHLQGAGGRPCARGHRGAPGPGGSAGPSAHPGTGFWKKESLDRHI